MPYPKRPYVAKHEAHFPSGYKRDLVFYGDMCAHTKCGESETFLDGGSPSCAKHLTGYCSHGKIACDQCVFPGYGATVVEAQPHRV